MELQKIRKERMEDQDKRVCLPLAVLKWLIVVIVSVTVLCLVCSVWGEEENNGRSFEWHT